jgi:DNA helicase-2/ATP-dependent DNA helicase PcrA
MRSNSRAILASAGSGKTTTIVREAGKNREVRAELITYTINGREELIDAAYRDFGCVPRGLRIGTWFSFVLQHFVRPYQAHLHSRRAVSIDFSDGRLPRYIRKDNVAAFYFSGRDRLRRDRVTDFACKLIVETNGLPIERFRAICDTLYIDEAQDLSGYDLDLIELLLSSGIQLSLIGDCRQATFTTNNNSRNKAYVGANIIKKFEEWEKSGLLTIEHQFHSHRCVQQICDFADSLYPELGRTRSLNEVEDSHLGVFAVRERFMGL